MHVDIGRAVKRLVYTPEESRTALSISARKLWALTASGEIPHIRLGRWVRYPVDDLRRWIEERKTGGDDR